MIEAKDKYNYLRGKAESARQLLDEAQLNKRLYEEQLEALQIVGWLLTEAAILTQQRLKAAYENTVTAALNAVFDREHQFELEFDRRGQRLDCTAVVKTGGMVLDPKDEKGGSVVDIISFVARLAEWVLGGKKSRPVFFLDEPFKNLGQSGRLDQAIAVMRNLAATFGVQLIIITHTDQLASIADCHYVFSHDGEKTNAVKREIVGDVRHETDDKPTTTTKKLSGKPDAKSRTIARVR
jgi:DNA repair exonuclease SbcCD ATPase subunit